MKRGIWTLLVAMLLVMSAALAAPALAQGEGYGIGTQAGLELPCIDGYFYFAPMGSALELTGDFSEPSPAVTYHAWEGGDWADDAGSVLSGTLKRTDISSALALAASLALSLVYLLPSSS